MNVDGSLFVLVSANKMEWGLITVLYGTFIGAIKFTQSPPHTSLLILRPYRLMLFASKLDWFT